MSDRALPRADLLGVGLVLLAAACFGTLGPLSRFAGDAGVAALTLVTWRAAIGATFTGAFVVARWAGGGPRPVPLGKLPPRERWFILAAAGANTLLNLSVFIAFGRISIALALLVFYLYPAFVAVAAVAFFGERMDARRWLALALSLGGLVLVLTGAGSLGGVEPIGIGLALVGALAQVFYVFAARYGFASVPGPQAAAMTMGGAALMYLAIAGITGTLGALAQPIAGPAAFGPVLLAGVLGAGVPTMAYIVGIRLVGAPRAAILASFEPVVGVALAAWLLAERPTLLQVVGGVLIVAAAILLQRRARGQVADHEAVAAAD